jgi:hypothetical protein
MPTIEVLLLAAPAVTILGFLFVPRKLQIAININIGRR